MDYEKKYNEALERARKVHRNYKNLFPEDSYSEDIEEIFPELAESEDEKIRRELIEYLRGDLDDITTDDTDRWIAWLEKQKEQKPAWSEEDERIMQTMIKEGDLKPSEIAWLNRIRPSWKPSEEQIKAFKESLMSVAYTENKTILESLYEQLKKL